MARRFVRTTLERAGWAGDAEAAVLLTSELVANALQHGGAPCFLTIRLKGPTLRVEAAHADEPSGPDEADPAKSPSGGGLMLLEALATVWGSQVAVPDETTVWFEMPSHAA